MARRVVKRIIAKEKDRRSDIGYGWGNFVSFLQNILSKKENTELQLKVEEFIVLTELLDDLMDRDKLEIFHILYENQESFSKEFVLVLDQLKQIVSERKYRLFVDSISKALLWQQYEVEYKLSEQSNMDEYFMMVNKSVYLMQSIVYLVEENPDSDLLMAIKYLAIEGQIKNDLINLGKDNSSDITHRKPTLPLIKLSEWVVENNYEDISCLLFSNRDKLLTREEEHLIKQVLENSGIISFCHILSQSFSNKMSSVLFENYGVTNYSIFQSSKKGGK